MSAKSSPPRIDEEGRVRSGRHLEQLIEKFRNSKAKAVYLTLAITNHSITVKRLGPENPEYYISFYDNGAQTRYIAVSEMKMLSNIFGWYNDYRDRKVKYYLEEVFE